MLAPQHDVELEGRTPAATIALLPVSPVTGAPSGSLRVISGSLVNGIRYGFFNDALPSATHNSNITAPLPGDADLVAQTQVALRPLLVFTFQTGGGSPPPVASVTTAEAAESGFVTNKLDIWGPGTLNIIVGHNHTDQLHNYSAQNIGIGINQNLSATQQATTATTTAPVWYTVTQQDNLPVTVSFTASVSPPKDGFLYNFNLQLRSSFINVNIQTGMYTIRNAGGAILAVGPFGNDDGNNAISFSAQFPPVNNFFVNYGSNMTTGLRYVIPPNSGSFVDINQSFFNWSFQIATGTAP